MALLTPTNRQWWIVALVALFAVAMWPPDEGRSLATKAVNWAVDPSDRLPVLPGPLALGLGDDPDAVNAHDMEEQRYSALAQQGRWMRARLELKVARAPFTPSTGRQLLTVLVVLTLLVSWRMSGRGRA